MPRRASCRASTQLAKNRRSKSLNLYQRFSDFAAPTPISFVVKPRYSNARNHQGNVSVLCNLANYLSHLSTSGVNKPMKVSNLVRVVVCNFVAMAAIATATSRSTRAYAPMYAKFPSNTTTYKIDSSLPTNWAVLVPTAVANWTPYFNFVEDQNSSSIIRGEDFGNCNTYADASYTASDAWTKISFLIRFNTRSCPWEIWDGTGTQGAKVGFSTILRHELGHALGLCHVNDPNGLMYWSIDPGVFKPVDIDSSNGAQYLYDANFDSSGSKGIEGLGCGQFPNFPPGSRLDDYTISPALPWGGGNAWVHQSGVPAASNNGTSSYTWAQGARTSVAFSGKRISYVHTVAANRTSDVKAFINNTTPSRWAVFSSLANSTRRGAIRTWVLPTTGSHTLEIRKTQSSGFIDLDEWIIDIGYAPVNQTVDNPTNSWVWYRGVGWSHVQTTGAYNNSLSYSQTQGDNVVFTCEGTSIKWVFSKAANRGKADITLDGSDWATIDMYNPTTIRQQSLTWNAGFYGIHTIHISNRGEKNLSSSGYFIDADAFQCIP
jgi:hypothetical protein